MDPHANFYFGCRRASDKYLLDLDKIINISSLDELVEGYCILVNAKWKDAKAYKDKVLVTEGSEGEIYRFLMLRLFLDKYESGEHVLPELDEVQRVGQSKAEAIQWNRTAMEIMLQPLGSYEDLLASFDEVNDKLSFTPTRLETFDGYKSQKKTLSGEIPDWEDFDYRVYKRVKDGVWTISSAVDRGNGRLELLMWIYGTQHLNEYILNNHIHAVI